MPSIQGPLNEQLRLAVRASGARWAAWVLLAQPADQHTHQWIIGPGEGLSKARQKALFEFLNLPSRNEWISGALSHGHPRWQETGPLQSRLNCGRVYLYPCSPYSDETQRTALLVAGADGLSSDNEMVLRVVGLIPPRIGPDNNEPCAPDSPGSSLAYEQLEALYETSLEITARLELNTVLQRIALRARELAEARGAEVGLIERRPVEDGLNPEVEEVVHIIISETHWPTFKTHYIPFLTGLAGKIAAMGSALIIADYNEWDGRMLPERFAPFKAAAGVPLVLDGNVIGTLTVLDDRPEKRFTAEDIHILEMFGAQAAAAIQNARLYTELSKRIEAQQRAEKRLFRAAQMAALGDISTQIANEINAPLMRTTTLLELVLKQLVNPALPPTALRDLRLAYQQAQRAREMTHRLLMAARDTQPILVEED